MHRRLTRIACFMMLAAAASLAVVGSASADYHLNKIRQISGEGGASLDTSYIELQMYAPGQNLVSGRNITIWDQDALLLGLPQPIATLPLSGPNPPNGENQRTILIGDTAVAGRDFTLDLSVYLSTLSGGPDPKPYLAGAACFDTIDCVSWGAFTGAANLPDKTTPNGSVLPITFSLQRSIAPGCPTLLEEGDDTNNAQTDFVPGPKEGRPNSVPPPERPCGGGQGAGGGGGFTSCAGKLTTIVGTDGNDALTGTAAADVIAAGAGNDVIRALAGNDVVCAGLGKDRLVGGKGNDTLLGEAAKDTLRGGAGNDKLKGGSAADTLKGGPGRDKLKGGPGKDVQIQ
jgi:RTX calcium-binding nonapeptide repeat (4 copies)